MGYRRSYRGRRQKQMPIEDTLFACFGFVLFIILFVLLYRYGIMLVGTILVLLLCLIGGVRYGQPLRLLYLVAPARLDQPGFKLPSPEQVWAQERPQVVYGQGYRPQAPSQSPRQTGNIGQVKDDHPAYYEQPQAKYPENMPPAP